MKSVQLICVGYAGSVASAFNNMLKFLGDEIVLSTVEYRGRGKRSRETEYESNYDMETDVAEQIQKLRVPEMPYALLGYSMGSQVVYEIFAKGLLQEVPTCFFLASHEPPDVACYGKGVDIEDEDKFIRQIQRFGGIDTRLLEDERFRSIILSRMKSDYRMLKEYKFSGEYKKFPAKTVMCYSEKDIATEVIRGWERFADKKIVFYELGNSHFFYKTETKEWCNIIRKELGIHE